MAPLSPSSPLHSDLNSLSLLSPGMHGQLQDEDLTLTLGDDSFDGEEQEDGTERLQQPVFGSSAAGGAREQQTKAKADVAFGGSMGVLSPVPSSSLPSPLPPPPAATPSARLARESEEDADLDVDYELLEGGEGAGEGSGITEEERKRIVQLREERDGLRSMNRTLEGLLSGLKGMEGKLQVSRPSLSLGTLDWD